jgi:drug/metabolite transporter (DMT)-like permease
VRAGAPGDTRSLWTGIAFGCLCALIWGIQAVISRQSVADGLTAADVTILRFLLAGLVLAPWALRLKPPPVGRLGWTRAAILACLAGAPYSLALVGGAAFAPAIHSGVIGPGLIPPMSALLAYLFLGERTNRGRLFGIALIVVGIGLFSWEALIGAGARAGAWRGDLLFVLTAVMWASFGLMARRWGVGAIEGTACICALSLLSMPLWAPFLPVRLTDASVAALTLQAVYQGLLVGVVSLFLYTRCVALLGPIRAALFVPLVPLVAAVGGVLFLGEQPSARELTGMLTVIGGMVVAFNLGRR